MHTKLNEVIQNRPYLLLEFCPRGPQIISKYSPIVGISQVLCMGPRGGVARNLNQIPHSEKHEKIPAIPGNLLNRKLRQEFLAIESA